ncbi:MAG: hypothetical protein ACXWA9_03215 [Acidimicrobiia bacterium]
MGSIGMRGSRGSTGTASSGGALDLALAWVSAFGVPVAIGVGRFAATEFLSSQGYSTSESEPPGLGLVSFLLLALVVLVPVATGVWFGVRASRAGHPSGAVAALIAAVIGGGLVLVGLPIYLSRLIGWPAAVACGVAIVVIVAVVARAPGRHTPDALTARRNRS